MPSLVHFRPQTKILVQSYGPLSDRASFIPRDSFTTFAEDARSDVAERWYIDPFGRDANTTLP